MKKIFQAHPTDMIKTKKLHNTRNSFLKHDLTLIQFSYLSKIFYNLLTKMHTIEIKIPILSFTS